jgi:DNA replication and repair protein RecF
MISKLELSNFRNFSKKSLTFFPGVTCIIGPNASGKSNILESLYLLSIGKSFRAKIEEEMINYESDITRVCAAVADGKIGNTEALRKIEGTEKTSINLEVVLTRGFIDIGKSAPEKVARKKLLVNGVAKRLVDFAGSFKTVLFGPWDLDLVTESPSIRRKFLDMVLSQVDREYRRANLSYEKGLRQRNKLLFRIREESLPAGRQGLSHSQLLFWNQLLIKNGDYLSEKRQEFINFANNTSGLDSQVFKLEYDKSAISEARLEQYAREEVAAATTLVGPHRDDFIFKIRNPKHEIRNKNERELARYGSRGEQRMGVLWLKMVELAFIEEKSGDLPAQAGKPTLLLDDIFSELDHEHRDVVMELAKNQQTIITTADEHFIKGISKRSTVILLS